MGIRQLSNIRVKLPYQYGKLIAQKLDGVSASQVRMVFRGEITNPEIVDKVLKEAVALAERTVQQQRLLMRRNPRNKSLKTKLSV